MQPGVRPTSRTGSAPSQRSWHSCTDTGSGPVQPGSAPRHVGLKVHLVNVDGIDA